MYLCLLLVLSHTKLNDNVSNKCSLKYILFLAIKNLHIYHTHIINNLLAQTVLRLIHLLQSCSQVSMVMTRCS